MKITLKCEQPTYDIFTGKSGAIERTITHEFEMSELGDALENIELFLRGIGYSIKGQLDIVDEDDKQPSNELNYDFAELEKQWLKATPNTFGSQPNEPLDNPCKQCGLPKNVMAQHKCWDPRCPIHLN
jgi:hypothetical protein